MHCSISTGSKQIYDAIKTNGLFIDETDGIRLKFRAGDFRGSQLATHRPIWPANPLCRWWNMVYMKTEIAEVGKEKECDCL